MNKLEAAGRLIQWAVELSEFDIRYQPRNAIKAQALADFIAEFTPIYEDHGEGEYDKKWVVHVDGSSTSYAGRIGVPTVVEGLQRRKQSKRRPEMTGQTPSDEKVSIVKTLLPSSCHQCHDRPSAQKGNEQAGSRRTTDSMGGGT